MRLFDFSFWIFGIPADFEREREVLFSTVAGDGLKSVFSEGFGVTLGLELAVDFVETGNSSFSLLFICAA